MQTTLPPSSRLPIEYLAASFSNVTNSYKFFWLLAILDHLRETGETTISINHLVARMIAGAWYPGNYFRLSFGKQDQLGKVVLAIRAELDLPTNAPKSKIISAALAYSADNSGLAKQVRSLADYVPYRLLRPFFSAPLRGVADAAANRLIRQMADDNFAAEDTPCLYRFVDDGEPSIELHPQWTTYLQINLAIVTGYCLWHLTNYLQKNNPNAPNITGKLFEPGQRNLRDARKFWNLALAQIGPLRCIYSGEAIDTISSLDHFLPWSFVAHDLLWNIIPTSRSVNSAKGDQLPDFGRYFEPFALQQYQSLQTVAETGSASLVEDYFLLLKAQSIDDVRMQSFHFFRDTLWDTIAPQMQIARNMGFTADWSYLT